MDAHAPGSVKIVPVSMAWGFSVVPRYSGWVGWVRPSAGFWLLGVEAGQEGADAELELVVGGDAGQQRGQLDVVGELARREGGEEGPHAADELVAGLGVGAGPGDLEGDEPKDVGQQGIDDADHGLVGEPGGPQGAIDGFAQAQAVGA